MKKSLSILLSFMLLASHMYLTVGTHFCSGEAVESKILFGQTHLGCGMMDMEQPCSVPEKADHQDTRYDKPPCCENQYQTVQASNVFIKDKAQIALPVEFALAFIYTILNFDLLPKSTHQFYTEYISPPLEKDIPILFQTFLI